MSTLKHPVTGHEVNTDDASVSFWESAGYRSTEQKAPAKKTATKRAASKKSSSDK